MVPRTGSGKVPPVSKSENVRQLDRVFQLEQYTVIGRPEGAAVRVWRWVVWVWVAVFMVLLGLGLLYGLSASNNDPFTFEGRIRGDDYGRYEVEVHKVDSAGRLASYFEKHDCRPVTVIDAGNGKAIDIDGSQLPPGKVLKSGSWVRVTGRTDMDLGLVYNLIEALPTIDEANPQRCLPGG